MIRWQVEEVRKRRWELFGEARREALQVGLRLRKRMP